MPTTPFAETEALIAVMNGDQEEALRILADLTEAERRQLAEHADELSGLADPANQCPGCGRFVDVHGATVMRGRERWHRNCFDNGEGR